VTERFSFRRWAVRRKQMTALAAECFAGVGDGLPPPDLLNKSFGVVGQIAANMSESWEASQHVR